MPGEHHHGLQRVEPLLRDFHGSDYATKSIVLVDFIEVGGIANMIRLLRETQCR
jgi:hypothetical protein